MIALIATLSAVWIGLHFANYLVAPIRRLISAANLVSTGNLLCAIAHPPLRRRPRASRRDLQQDDAGATHPARRSCARARPDRQPPPLYRSGAGGRSAGVIGVDAEGRVSILNRSAERLIGHAEAEALGKPLAEVAAGARGHARRRAHRRSQRQGQITISRNGKERNLSVRVTSEQETAADHGYVITLDDITDLVSAQRTSAWADVARRIAHEIKNPLTPIQLSAERLRRKYGKTIVEDRDVFEQCTDTIVRQVDDIKRMVDEFSRFARTPKPVMTPTTWPMPCGRQYF